MTPFEEALLQAVCEDFSEVPQEQELELPAISLKKANRSKTLRRCVLIAAACLVLAGSVLGTYVIKHRIGSVAVESDFHKIFGHEITVDDDNTYFALEFTEKFASPDAPSRIETYYLPTYMVSMDTFEPRDARITKEEIGTYFPFKGGVQPNVEYEDIPRILAAPGEVSYLWKELDGYEPGGYHIRFRQILAKDATDETPYGVHLVYGTSEDSIPSYETIEIDEYSVFTFEVDSTGRKISEGWYGDVWRHWFWTDGDYLFWLSSSHLTEEEMTELFRSVKPVSTEYPFRRSEAPPHRAEEHFNLIEDSSD